MTPHTSMRITVIATALIVFAHIPGALNAQSREFHVGPEVDRRIDSLLAMMSVEEKAGQLNQVPGAGGRGEHLSPGIQDSIRRGLIGSFLNVVGAERTREAQRLAVENSRLHIPLLFGLDVIHGFRTIFPIPLGEASCWDPGLVEQSCRIAASEAAENGINWTFAPMVDIARDPRWGRIAEGSGEDPCLGSAFAAARVRGFQGTGFADSTTLVACAKHFAAYGAVEAGRDYNTTDISERTLRDVYLPPFHAAVDAGVGTLMSAFTEIGGVPNTENRALLTGVLRDGWGFQGFVVSDWNAIAELRVHGVAGSDAEAARKALNAGVDMDMVSRIYVGQVPDLARSGAIPMHVLDDAVRRILRVKFALGLFTNPYRNCLATSDTIAPPSQEHRRAARVSAIASIVLLKNAGGLLPLQGELGRIAVIGPLAESRSEPLGPWHARGRSEDAISIIDGLTARFPKGAVRYARGTDLTFTDTTGFSDAVAAAAASEVSVIVAGETAGMSGEAASRSEIGLPGVQEALVRRVVATGKPVVLLLMNGRPLCLPWEAEHVQAIVETWFGGIEAGNAAADVLLGSADPSGKLPVTFPRSVGQIPLTYNAMSTGRPYRENERFTSKYLDIANTPEYPFGYGLSYTTFAFDHLNVQTPRVRIHEPVRISVEVANTGRVRGEETVQMYLHQEVADVVRPVLELKAFQKISLAPGERRTVTCTFGSDQLGFTGADMKYIVEPGTFRVFVGGSSVETLEGRFILVPQEGSRETSPAH